MVHRRVRATATGCARQKLGTVGELLCPVPIPASVDKGDLEWWGFTAQDALSVTHQKVFLLLFHITHYP